MQSIIGTIPMGQPTIATGMPAMLVLVNGMGTITSASATPRKQPAVHAVAVIPVFGMLFVKVDEVLEKMKTPMLQTKIACT